MSEQQNVSLIQKMFDAFGRGDVQTILENCAVDCEFYCPGPTIIPYTGTKKGRAEIQTYFDAILGTQSNQDLRIDQIVAQGDTVVAIGLYKSSVKSTGKAIESPVVLTFEVRDGTVRRHMSLGDTAAVAASYTASAAAAGG
jgi:ketosteroid isomerase-like protein